MDLRIKSCSPWLAAAIAGASFFLQCAAVSAQTEQELLRRWADHQRLIEEEKWDAALESAGYLYDVAGMVWDAGDGRLAVLAINYATLLDRLGHRQEALELLQITQNEFGEIYGEDAPELVDLIVARGDLAARDYDARKQKDIYEKALSINSDHYGRRSVEYADLALRLGRNITEMSRTDDGEKFIKDAYRIYSRELGEQHFKTGLASFFLGRLAFASGRRRRAEKYMEQALEAFDPASEEAVRWNLLTRKSLVYMYNRRNRADLAAEQIMVMAEVISLGSDDSAAPLKLFGLAPVYPPAMLQEGKEGSVQFAFTIDEKGFVRDPEILQVNGGDAFIDAAKISLESYRYVPRFVDGQTVATDGVEARITFRIED